MSDIVKGVEEALAVAKGEQPAARVHMNGHTYVPLEEYERLRKHHDECFLVWLEIEGGLITEIERLRAGNDDMRHTIHQWEPNMAALRAEITSLRAALKERDEDRIADMRIIKAEIERLRAALERMLLEFDFMVEAGIISDVRDDIIFVEARAALTKETDWGAPVGKEEI